MKNIPIRNPEYLFRVTETGSVVLMTFAEDDFFWQINGLAADLWKDIDGNKTWDEIKNLHRAESNLSDSEFNKEASNFLQELITNKIVTLK